MRIGLASRPCWIDADDDDEAAMEKPRFDDETGAALNAAAERLVQRAKAAGDDGPSS